MNRGQHALSSGRRRLHRARRPACWAATALAGRLRDVLEVVIGSGRRPYEMARAASSSEWRQPATSTLRVLSVSSPWT
jgi:hypothetical protein